MNVAIGCERRQDAQVTSRQARQAEERDARRKVDKRRLTCESRAGSLESLRRTTSADLPPRGSPELCLPVRLRPGGPSENHVGAVKLITGKEAGNACGDSEAARRVPFGMCTELLGPRFAVGRVDGLQQWPDESLGRPRIFSLLDARSGRYDFGDQPPRRRELDVRADPEL